ncbi:hypothetical protein PYCCODRAFT_317321 [Trametes coccinea BRFM310]|uniref:Uncharacterized protein n=1 Tax=Trametes coccinea (strain BRFM310) TaxID=1353009 RepID=A0A1Y2IN41_TRAC3|nr:hypothetical protein PYCCODRAFT_317321 [Trametes coccinea BRFM310]
MTCLSQSYSPPRRRPSDILPLFIPFPSPPRRAPSRARGRFQLTRCAHLCSGIWIAFPHVVSSRRLKEVVALRLEGKEGTMSTVAYRVGTSCCNVEYT